MPVEDAPYLQKVEVILKELETAKIQLGLSRQRTAIMKVILTYYETDYNALKEAFSRANYKGNGCYFDFGIDCNHLSCRYCSEEMIDRVLLRSNCFAT